MATKKEATGVSYTSPTLNHSPVETEDRPADAALYQYNTLCESPNPFGGGMSATESRMAKMRGQVIADTSPAKDTTGGTGLGRDERNVIKKFATANVGENVTPAATKQSGNPDQKRTY